MRISAARKTISARRGAGTRRHFVKARLAASTAASTSALADFWKTPTTSRVSAGLRSSKVSPVEDSTHSPSMKFLTTLVGIWPSVAGDVRVSVAIIAPYECSLLMLQKGQKVRQGRVRRGRRGGRGGITHVVLCDAPLEFCGAQTKTKVPRSARDGAAPSAHGFLFLHKSG